MHKLTCHIALPLGVTIPSFYNKKISYHQLPKDKLIQQLIPDCNLKCKFKPTAILTKFSHKMITKKHRQTSVARAN